MMQRCIVRHQFVLAGQDTQFDADDDAAHFSVLQGDLSALPLPSNALDGVVVQHALEAQEDPRTALREVTRALRPGGRLVLCAFNPWSVLGLRRAYARVLPDLFSGLRFPNPIRVLDWLAVLGYELEGPVRYVSYGLPFRRGARQPQADLPEPQQVTLAHAAGGIEIPFADVYMLSAIKLAHCVRPLRLQETKSARPFIGEVAYPRLKPALTLVKSRRRNPGSADRGRV